MKIWNGYGSEHSSNLVMIGRFKEPADANTAKLVIERIIEQVTSDVQSGVIEVGERSDRFPNEVREILWGAKLYGLQAQELEQFAYDVSITTNGNEVILKTDEIDVAVFLKVLLAKGARVEVFSAHDYPGTGHGRGE